MKSRRSVSTLQIRIANYLSRHRLIDEKGMKGAAAAALLMLSIVCAMLLAWCAARLTHEPLQLTGTATLTAQCILRAFLCVAALSAIIARSRIEGRSWLSYGLRAPHPIAHFTVGVLAGVILLTSVMLVLASLGVAKWTMPSPIDLPAITEGLSWAVVFALVAWSEELVFRGYIFLGACARTHPVKAAIRASVLFGAVHLANHGETALGIAQVVAFGFVACFAVWRMHSLWGIAGFHAAWDWAQSYVFGVADSGMSIRQHWMTSQLSGPAWLSCGATGPEASLFSPIALAVLALMIHSAWPRRASVGAAAA